MCDFSSFLPPPFSRNKIVFEPGAGDDAVGANLRVAAPAAAARAESATTSAGSLSFSAVICTGGGRKKKLGELSPLGFFLGGGKQRNKRMELDDSKKNTFLHSFLLPLQLSLLLL